MKATGRGGGERGWEGESNRKGRGERGDGRMRATGRGGERERGWEDEGNREGRGEREGMGG